MLQDAETGQRGYLLTGKESSVDPYNSAVEQIPEVEIAALRTAFAGDGVSAPQLNWIESAVRDKLGELRRTIELATAGDKAGALALVNTDKGKALMDRIRDAMQAINADEQQKLSEAQAQSLEVVSIARTRTVLALALTMLLGALVIRDAHRLLQDAIKANDALQVANHQIMDEMLKKERVEQQLRQTQKLEAMGQLTGGVAHDFNNLLTPIIGSLDLLARRRVGGEREQRLIHAAYQSAERARVLVQRLLAFARRQPLQSTAVDVGALVRGMADLLASTTGPQIALEVAVADDLFPAKADPNQLEMAILNLGVNARDAIEGSGCIETATRRRRSAPAYRRARARPLRPALRRRHRPRHGRGEAGARDRTVFLDQGRRQGDRARPSRCLRLRPAVRRTDQIYSEPGQGTTVKLYLPRFFGDAARTGAGGRGRPRGGCRWEARRPSSSSSRMRRGCAADGQLRESGGYGRAAAGWSRKWR